MIKRLAGRCGLTVALAVVVGRFPVLGVAPRALGERLQRLKDFWRAGFDLRDAWLLSGMPAIAGGAGIAAKDTTFKLDEAVAALTDISTRMNQIDFPEEVGTVETTPFQRTAEESIVTLSRATISINGHWDATIDAHLAGIKAMAASRTFEYGPAGSGAGAVRYTGECYLTSYQKGGESKGADTYSAAFLVTGSVTRNTWP